MSRNLIIIALILFYGSGFVIGYSMNPASESVKKKSAPKMSAYQKPPPQNTEIDLSVPILLYHYVEYVTDERDTIRKSLNINPAIFESQINALKEASYEAIFASDLAVFFDKGKKLPAKPLIITFDDGNRDFYTDALPILKKYQMKSVVFVIPGFFGIKNYLTEEQVKEIATSDLVEIGSHTVHHKYLKKASLISVREELEQSKNILEEMIKRPVTSFAYPYGAYDEAVIDMVKKSGYTIAITTDKGIIQSKKNRYTLLRLRPGRRTGRFFTSWLESL